MPSLDFITLSFLENPESIFLIISVVVLSITAGILYAQFRNKSTHQLEEEDVSDESFQIISNAIKSSKEIIDNASLLSLKMSADSRFLQQKFEKKVEENLSTSLTGSEKLLEDELAKLRTEIQKAESEFQIYLNDLKLKSELAQNKNQQLISESIGSQTGLIAQAITEQTTTIKQHINKLFENFEQNLSQFLTKTEQQSVEAIDAELKASRQLVDTYKNEQLRLIDENIIAILEKTLSLVLPQKISLKDQVDLVYEALERAKVEKFIQ